MVKGDDNLSLIQRIKILVTNFIVVYIAYFLASGRLLPTGGLESVWLFSALAMWFLTLLSAPWFVPPRDAFVNAISAGVILVTIDLTSVAQFQQELNIIRWAAYAYCTVVVSISLFTLFQYDRDNRSKIGKFTFRITGILGGGEALYTPPALISIVGTYQQNLALAAWLIFLWVLFVVGRPVQRIMYAWRQWRVEGDERETTPTVGTIDRIDHPNIIRVRLSRTDGWKSKALYVAAMPDGGQRFVFALFTQMQGVEVIGTGLCIAPLQEYIDLPTGYVCASHDAEKAAEFIENMSGTKDAELVGFTVENSSIGLIRFEVAASSGLAEGNVVFAKIDGADVFYQILDAETAEESFDQNPRGTHIVRAAQLGNYSAERGFTKFPWLPTMNTPLFAALNRDFPEAKISEGEFEIGKVPSTNIGVIASIDDLVEYHTAILGITGTGKTELALDVVREAASNDVKVFCVDFTGEYRHRLNELNPELPGPTEMEAVDLEEKIYAVETGQYGGQAQKPALKRITDDLSGSTAAQVDAFLRDDEKHLAIFELAEIANTKASLRLTEMYLSSIMDWAKKHRRARKIMIVLEEAHTIIPETFGSGFDRDTQWVVSRIGQIALQGRKYGVGLVVITQRTALVSKTILSQCNTFFTHSLIDQTSLGFLESVYSSQHVRLIPNLGRYEFLAFGKAIRAERPIVLKSEFDQNKKDASDGMRQYLDVDQSQVEGDKSTAPQRMADFAEMADPDDYF